MKHVLKNVSYFALTFNEAWQMLLVERGASNILKNVLNLMLRIISLGSLVSLCDTQLRIAKF